MAKKFEDTCPLKKPFMCFHCPFVDCISTTIQPTKGESKYKACGLTRDNIMKARAAQKKMASPKYAYKPFRRYHLYL